MELNFKLAVHATDLGKYKTEEAFIHDVEKLVETHLEKKLKAEVGVNIMHDEVPVKYFNCLYESEGKEVPIPFATQLRGKEEINAHLVEFGYAPDEYAIREVYNITEAEYQKNLRNRHGKDPLKSDMGKDMKYFRILDSTGELLTYIGSRRTFKSQAAVVAYGKELGKLPEDIHCTVEFDVPNEEFFLWKYGVKSGKKNNHYIVSATFSDGRVSEYYASLATKLLFDDLADVETHMVDIGKIKEGFVKDSVVLEKTDLKTYKKAKEYVESRKTKKASTSMGDDSAAELHDYTDFEDYEG